MKQKIFYGVAGEGLGHAARAYAVIENMPEYEFHVFTFGKAYSFFKKMNYPFVYEIKGLMFSYKGSKVDYVRTVKNTFKFLTHDIKKNLAYITNKAKEINPSLFITDFEPSIPRVALRLCKQSISIDNQHCFNMCTDPALSDFLKLYCKF